MDTQNAKDTLRKIEDVLDDINYTYIGDAVDLLENWKQEITSQLISQKNPSSIDIAETFSRILWAWLSPYTMKKIIDRNKKETNSSICHSHDFCDANMIMTSAMAAHDISKEQEHDFWDEAWNIAKSNHFFVTNQYPTELKQYKILSHIDGFRINGQVIINFEVLALNETHALTIAKQIIDKVSHEHIWKAELVE